MPTPRPVRRSLITGLTLLLVAAGLIASRPAPAAADVTHLYGFQATVDGFTSWYGSYGMGPLGMAWCIDHGIRSPDPAFAYAAADLSAVPDDTRAAMAWAVGVHGQGTDRVTHAALMLVLHDLMGARYPSGLLDVGLLNPSRLAGFDGLEAEVLDRARAIKADALAHQHLRAPLHATVALSPMQDDGTVAVTVTVGDVDGRGVPGVVLQVDAPGGGLAATQGTTADDGTWGTIARPAALPLSVQARATVPQLTLDAWAPTTQPAQRVARSALDQLTATATLAAPPPTTTTTVPPTTTTVPPTTVPAVQVPPSSSTSTTGAPPAPVPPPPPTVVSSPPPSPSLPRTGTDAVALTLAALGLVLLGSAALDTARRRAPALAAIGHHGNHGGRRSR